ncbi:mevalonate kinase family protein [Poseidonocella sedimentorum]|uniref:Mevalonate kinase n=1 Tax=Poseidonocella sedimentorum TaxID=871652 RepID=A0A1I6ERA0_9RHOB|nr:hypothetical protein [Poseidonocella sedimentorum]SFR20205.1 mevalonate kinase [Poseidonocella sedimentorum]
MIRASAPGSIMITGEHAVVYGHSAIVAAIDQRITVELLPQPGPEIDIASDIAPPLFARLDALPHGGPYRFVLAAIAGFAADLPGGVSLRIRSEIDPTLGLGSSAAVTIATLGALARYADHTPDDLHTRALGIIRALQGRGSGADLASSLTGGMISYRAPEAGGPAAKITALPAPPPLSLRYAGYKTPTADVLALVAARMEAEPERYRALYAQMGAAAETAIAAATAQDWPALAASLQRYQTYMEALGVCDETLGALIRGAIAHPGTIAAKISGSGLGDCVVALGQTPPGFAPAPLAKEGLRVD